MVTASMAGTGLMWGVPYTLDAQRELAHEDAPLAGTGALATGALATGALATGDLATGALVAPHAAVPRTTTGTSGTQRHFQLLKLRRRAPVRGTGGILQSALSPEMVGVGREVPEIRPGVVETVIAGLDPHPPGPEHSQPEVTVAPCPPQFCARSRVLDM